MNKKNQHGKIWTNEEDDFLKENYYKIGRKGCSETLNRTMAAIGNRAKFLKILKPIKQWTKEEDQFLIDNYVNLGSVKCAKLMGVDFNAVNFRAKKYLNLKRNNKSKPWTEEELDFLRSYYPSKGSKFCAEKLERSRPVIISKAGSLKIKNKFQKMMNSKLIEMNTKSAAYVAGMLWADGGMTTGGKRLTISIASEDMDKIIHLFKEMGDWSICTIKRPNRKDQTLLQTNDKKVCEFFKEMEYDRKSYVEPTKILSKLAESSEGLIKYWVLGFSDGDGSFYVSRKGLSAGSKFVLSGRIEYKWDEIIKIFSSLGIDRTYIYRKSGKAGNYSTITLERKDHLIKFGNYIYENFEEENIGLPRKYEKFKDILSFFASKRPVFKPISLKHTVTGQEYNFETTSSAKIFLNTTHYMINNCCKKQIIYKGYKCSFKNGSEDSLLHTHPQ